MITRQKKVSAKSLFAFISTIVIFLNSGYYRSTTTDSYVPLILLIALAGMCFIVSHNRFFEMKLVSVPAVLTLAIIMSALLNFSLANVLSGVRVAATLLCSYMITCVLPLRDFSRYFSGMVKVIIIISLLFSLMLMAGVSFFPEVNGYFDLFIVTGKGIGSRAHGIFWEPGVFASMIIIAMLCEYFMVDKKVSPVGLIIYVAGLFATKSTAGLVILLIVAFGLIWKSLSHKNKSPVYTAIFIIVVVTIVVFYNSIVAFLVDLNPELFSKLIETESGTTSTRINGPMVNLEVFFEKPAFGWGFTESSAQILDKMPSTGDAKVVAQTSTSTQIMAAVGVLGIFYSLGFIFPIFNKRKLPHLGIELKSIIAVCMLLIVNKEPHIFIAVTWMMLFYINNMSRAVEEKAGKE